MPKFDWNEFLNLADKMANQALTIQGLSMESTYRTAISRAYYATYHVAFRIAKQLDPSFKPTKSQHQAVIDWYRTKTQPPVNTIGQSLTTLKTKRVHADYHDSKRITAAAAAGAVSLAQKTISEIEKLPGIWVSSP